MTRLWQIFRVTILMAVCFVAGTAQAADAVRVRGGIHPGYARVVFDWGDAVGYEARIEGEELVVRFERPGVFDLRGLASGLDGYVRQPQVARDGREVRFSIDRGLSLRHFKLGPKVVIDLSGKKSGKATKPTAAKSLPKVRVRVGEHPDFSRLVFDWEKPVKATVEQNGPTATIRFDRSADFDLRRFRTDPPDGISGLTASGTNGTSVVVATLQEGAKVKTFFDGHKFVLDVSRGAGTSKQAAKSKEAERDSPRAAPVTPVQAENTKTGTDSSKETASGATEPPVNSLAPSAQNPRDRIILVESDPKSKTDKSNRPQATNAQAGASHESKPASSKKAEKKAPRGPRGALSATADVVKPEGGQAPQGRRPEPDRQVVLEFEWKKPAKAAAFRRGSGIWLVFDRPAPEGLVERITETAPELGPVEIVDVPGATVLRLNAAPVLAPEVTRDGNLWKVRIHPGEQNLERVITPEFVDDEKVGRHVRFPLGGAGNLIWVTDPQIGDRFVVVPSAIYGQGVKDAFRYPQFHALPTQLGVVLLPQTDGIEVASSRQGVLVREKFGLLLSAEEERTQPDEETKEDLRSARLFTLPVWRRGDPETFIDEKQSLLKALVTAEGPRVGIARYELARFYFAYGMTTEALGILRVIAASAPRLASGPEALLMKAASEFLGEDFHAAAKSLAHPALIGEREADLWRAALSAAGQDWQAAVAGFAASEDLIDDYAPPVRKRLRLLAAESHLGVGDTGGATLQLTRVANDEPTEAETLAAQYLNGLRLYLDGQKGSAVMEWKQVAQGAHRPSQARARLSLLESGLEVGSVTTAEAIEELERLRFAWRGDAFEMALLARLSDLYVKDKRYREGLKALKDAAAHLPDSDASRHAVEKMREVFAQLFLSDDGFSVPPLRALAIYDEFQELTPPGDEGDKLITRLADRLVEIDLLDQAGEILDGQVRYRLQGRQAARVASRLALIRLLDHKPEAAIEALDLTEVEDLPDDLVRHRRHLRARALSDQGQHDEALALLENDGSLDAVQLRAEVFWTQREWDSAAAELARLLPPADAEQTYNETESRALLNTAIAYSLADDRGRLKLLYRRYAKGMEQTEHWDAFKLLAGEANAEGIRTIGRKLESISPAQNFLASYREKLKTSGVGGTEKATAAE